MNQHVQLPADVRFYAKVVAGPNGCWIWTAARDRKGYGRFYYDGDLRLAHRASYDLHVGCIPDGYDIDHLCSVPWCVNPAHLEAVTKTENRRRQEERRKRVAA